ncbi:MAG: hypothetical protein OXU27_18160 [Candidatus Poribacteria bacterium]|nr:hypothetical protein [Candidatus Poribacteria bacterium]MDD9975940.1 hypothetical protein [Candidatus Poribacteria bacterium]
MDSSTYRKILEGYANVDSAKRGKLLRIYLHIPSLPKLRAARALLMKLKTGRGKGSLMRFSNRK